MPRLTARELSSVLPGNLRTLSALIARKPPAFTPEWATTVDEAFFKYTRTSTINLLLSWAEVLAARDWPFPAYLDLVAETNGVAFPSLRSGPSILVRLLVGRPALGDAILRAILSKGPDPLDEVMCFQFWRRSRSIFAWWRHSTLLQPLRRIILDIEQTYRRGLFAACIPTTLILFDYVLRDYFGTDNLRVSLQTLRNALDAAAILPKDFKPGSGIWDGLRDPASGNTFAGTLADDLRLPGVLLYSFAEFSNKYYGWYASASGALPTLNRHAVMHCANLYWTRANAVRILSFLDLTLRLEKPLKILIRGAA